MILTDLQGISNGEHINSTTNKVPQNGQDYQAMFAGTIYQALRNPLFEFSLDESGNAMPANIANQKINSWDSSSKV